MQLSVEMKIRYHNRLFTFCIYVFHEIVFDRSFVALLSFLLFVGNPRDSMDLLWEGAFAFCCKNTRDLLILFE